MLRLSKDEAGVSKGETEPKKWSPRATLLFTIGVCSAFWILVGYLLLR